MDHQGHGLALEHPIFTTPHAAKFEYVETKRPKQYEGFKSPLYPEGVGETYRLAQFEKTKPEGWNPTIVSHEGFFTDIPGFENLAEGNSSKALGSLSLARQGPYFYWGYSIDPERLTKGAQDTLCNTLHYMAKQRGSITVDFVCKTRESIRVFSWLARDRGYERGLKEHLPGSLTDEARKTYTPTWEGLDAWIEKYLPYVFSGRGPQHIGRRYKTLYEIDNDAMALKTPNDARASLEKWMSLAQGEGQGDDAKRARRCLARYVHPSIAPKDDKWTAWYAKYKDRIAFIESTGFWWQESPVVLEAERRQALKSR